MSEDAGPKDSYIDWGRFHCRCGRKFEVVGFHLPNGKPIPPYHCTSCDRRD